MLFRSRFLVLMTRVQSMPLRCVAEDMCFRVVHCQMHAAPPCDLHGRFININSTRQNHSNLQLAAKPGNAPRPQPRQFPTDIPFPFRRNQDQKSKPPGSCNQTAGDKACPKIISGLFFPRPRNCRQNRSQIHPGPLTCSSERNPRSQPRNRFPLRLLNCAPLAKRAPRR